MKGRSRGDNERIITLAHQVESMARQKTLKPLEHYLKKQRAPKKPAGDAGAKQVLAMLARVKKKQDAKGKPNG